MTELVIIGEQSWDVQEAVFDYIELIDPAIESMIYSISQSGNDVIIEFDNADPRAVQDLRVYFGELLYRVQ
jgi:hypothetical protein